MDSLVSTHAIARRLTGISVDLVLTNKCSNLAAAQRNLDALELRGIVIKQMTPAQVAEAEHPAQEWIEPRERQRIVSGRRATVMLIMKHMPGYSRS